jgi:TetR/AcrR family fatty acid metabolism transcriptional regulator
MSKDTKKLKILGSATQVFAEKGFQYATMAEIAEKAGISTGLTYSYFKNKLDVLLSIILNFLQRINLQNKAALENAPGPLDKIYIIFHNFEDLLLKDEENLCLVKVLNEGLPHLVMISDQTLQEKRRNIIEENKKLIKTMDLILAEGQNSGEFDKTLSPSVLRQILCGAIERVIYGLFFSHFSGEDIGYKKKDAGKAIELLINKFIKK